MGEDCVTSNEHDSTEVTGNKKDEIVDRFYRILTFSSKGLIESVPASLIPLFFLGIYN